jgi:hypothetical protein
VCTPPATNLLGQACSAPCVQHAHPKRRLLGERLHIGHSSNTAHKVASTFKDANAAASQPSRPVAAAASVTLLGSEP